LSSPTTESILNSNAGYFGLSGEHDFIIDLRDERQVMASIVQYFSDPIVTERFFRNSKTSDEDSLLISQNSFTQERLLTQFSESSSRYAPIIRKAGRQQSTDAAVRSRPSHAHYKIKILTHCLPLTAQSLIDVANWATSSFVLQSPQSRNSNQSHEVASQLHALLSAQVVVQ
jgi:hypothetical protein